MYLRILKGIDLELVDRDVIRTQQEVERNTKVKDHIRDTCITELVDSWFQILEEAQKKGFSAVSNDMNRVYRLKELRFLADKLLVILLVVATPTINQGLSSAIHEVLLTDTICTNKCNMNSALFKEVTQHEKRNLSERNGGVKLA
ncbi:unnamed protein product [Porites evermanni]|uniref:Exportin-T n=1 Tax=Porites evermanni TaxID=104178 RepID=A0ABN8S8P4_9CNID|nr:unnamed protein product [Porites evermanni]